MKRLKQSSIERAFSKIGFEKTESGMWLCMGQSVGGRIAVRFTSQIELFDARWVNGSNVHIVSYWHWPSSLKELEKEIQDIRNVYSILCGTRFRV